VFFRHSGRRTPTITQNSSILRGLLAIRFHSVPSGLRGSLALPPSRCLRAWTGINGSESPLTATATTTCTLSRGEAGSTLAREPSATSAVTPFATFSSPLTEAVLLGNVAIHYPEQKLQWDTAAFEFPNKPEADRLLRRPYRDGWKIEGLG